MCRSIVMPHTNFHLDLKMAFDAVKDVGGGGNKGEEEKEDRKCIGR